MFESNLFLSVAADTEVKSSRLPVTTRDCGTPLPSVRKPWALA